jgi:general secretion pathway protein A
VPAHCNVAYIFNPKLTVIELLETVCHEFGLAVVPPAHRPATVKDYLDPLNDFLLQAHAAGRNNVLVIDEAQNLSPEVLEQLRLLTNLETSERKLLQIILIGQPELRTMLARPELEQLAQRVIARYHLDALGEEESAQYVRHRLEVCGLQRPLPFDRAALRKVHAASGGVPRRINLLCDRALLGAYAGGQGHVTRRIVTQAAAEVFPRTGEPARPWPRTMAAAVVGLAAGAGLLAAASRVSETPRATQMATMRMAPPASAVPTAAAPLRVAAASGASPSPVPAPRVPPTLLRDESAAWRELAQAWKLPVPEGEPCEALARGGVQCFNKTLSLAIIRQLGRPGIVTLDAQSGQPSYAILSALTDQTATLQAAGSEQTVTLAALAQRWQGDFSTLWRGPAGRVDKPREGEGGPAVEWAASRLAAIKGAPAPASPRLNATLRAELKAFQLAHGLPPDGRPGPLTYMQLNRASGLDEPRLRTEP